MADDLPTEYEDIILGTGLQESILAAALARIGRRVLHFDRNNYYSGEWASFHLQGILDWIRSYEEPREDPSSGIQTDSDLHQDLEDGLRLLAVPSGLPPVFNLRVASYVREQPIEDTTPGEAQSQETRDTNRPEGARLDAGVSAAIPPTGPSMTDGATPPAAVETQPERSASSSTESELSAPGGGEPGEPLCNSPSHSSESAGSSEPHDTQSQSEPSTGHEANNSSGSNDPPDASDPAVALDSSGGPVDPPGSQDQTESDGPNQGNGAGNLTADDATGVGSPPVEGVGGQHDAAEAPSRKEWTWKEIQDNWRRFNVDLAPKLMFCRGSMVSLLVQSRISRYAEFKAVSRLLTLIGDKLEHVPCSRSDVFSSRYVSMLEKRMLMKLIEFVLHYQDRRDDYEGYQDKQFSEFLQKRKLTPTLQHFVIHSIAMVTANTSTEKALEAMQFFLKSLGRYGNTAFLWTLYGSGELPQCFCRMSAVFGGIYMLRTTAKHLIVDSDNVCKGMIDSEGRKLTCSNVIMDHSYAAQSDTDAESTRFVSRAVLFTDKMLKESEGDEITFLTIPPLKEGEEPIRLLEAGSSACASPKGIFIVHLTRECGHADAEADLMPVIDTLFQDLQADLDHSSERPKVLWSMFFSYKDMSSLTVEELRSGQPSGVYVTGGPGASVGYQHAVKQAQEIFELICPGEEFLPPAPNPDDIIYEDPSGDNPGHSNKAGFEDTPEVEKKSAATAVSGAVSDTPVHSGGDKSSGGSGGKAEQQRAESPHGGCAESEEAELFAASAVSSNPVSSKTEMCGGSTAQ